MTDLAFASAAELAAMIRNRDISPVEVMSATLARIEASQPVLNAFLAPIRVMPAAEALAYRHRLERFEASAGGPLRGDFRHKSHLLFTWLADLVRHPRILDAVEDLYGPDLLCWTSNFYRGTDIASYNDPRGVGLR